MGWRHVTQILGGVCIGVGLLSLCSNTSELITGLIGPNEQMRRAEGLPQIAQDVTDAQYQSLQNRVYRGYFAVQGGLDSVAAVLLIVAGIGLLRLQCWARRVAMGWAGYMLVSTTAGVVMAYVYLFPKLIASSPQHLPAGAAEVMSVFMLLVLWVFPASLLTLLMLPSVKHAITQAAAARPLMDSASPQSVSAPPLTDERAAGPPPPTAQQTWRDDPWNDPEATP